MPLVGELEAVVGEAAARIRGSRYLIALTGAGLSVESGIPPFRGPGGIWTRYGEPPMNGFERFLADPKAAWEERLAPRGPMVELWETLQRARPNPGHVALAGLERRGLLRFTITQNVDDLHRAAGSERLGEIHGNYRLVRCLGCGVRVPREAVDVAMLPPRCGSCGGLLKSDTVSFGEPIPEDVLARCYEESERADCILVVGTSATVYPAAHFPVLVRDAGGCIIEVNPYETELTPSAAVVVRAPAAEALPGVVAALGGGGEEPRDPRS
jgi:NAD-dependent deacetylase